MNYAYEATPAPKDFAQRSDRITVDLEPLKLPTPYVVPVEDADLPPIPGPELGRERIGIFHYQSLVLDLDTGALRFACQDWRQEEPQEYAPEGVHWFGADPLREGYGHKPKTGRTLVWIVKSGNVFAPYLTAAEGNSLAERALPYARTLAEGLLRIGAGPDQFDFTAAAAIAGVEIDRLSDSTALSEALPPERRGAPIGPVYEKTPMKVYDAADLLNSAALERTFYQHDITQASDELLMDAAYSLAVSLGRQTPGGADPEFAGCSLVSVVGTRAALFAARSKLTEGRTPVPAEEWFARFPEAVKRLNANVSDDDLEQIAEAAQAGATLSGVQITGAGDYLREQRRELREEVRWELEKAGREVSTLEKRLREQRAKRSGLLLSVLSWGERDTDADLGRTASMSRQAVQQLREREMGTEGDQ